jgi:hypothetical protein
MVGCCACEPLGASRTLARSRPLPPGAVGAAAGVGTAVGVGLLSYFGAKLAGRLAGPIAVGSGILVGGVVGYLAGTTYAARRGL